MAVNFPDSPSNGATHSVGDIVYTYNSTKGVWADTATGSTPSLETSDNPPSSPTDGDLWFNTSDLTTYIYYADGSSNQWVKANPSQAGVAGAQGPAGADGADGGSTVGTLTKSFSTNEESTITLSSAISPVPNVSVFKEVPQDGLTSKGNWDVNSNATNYDFFDEKPISYSSANLTPSATGDGTFTNSAANTSGFAVSAAAYDNVSFSASSQVLNGGGIAFKPDGLTMYLVNSNNDNTFQYTLTTAFDISTASYANKTYTHSETASGYFAGDIVFKPDGTKYWLVAANSSTGDRIFQYSMSTAWDISTSSYDSVSFATGISMPNGLAFKPDGTRLFVSGYSGATNKPIRQVDLSTAWDLSTATYNSVSFDTSPVLGQVSSTDWPTSLHLNSDGSKIFVSTKGSDKIYEYAMSTAYDLSTISYSNIDFSATSQEQDLYGITFSNDGTKMYAFGYNDTVYQYSSAVSLAFNAADIGKKVVGNSGSAIITATSGTYTSVTPFADTSTISSWQLFSTQGKADGSGIELSGYSSQSDIVFPTGASGSGASMVYSNNVSPTTSALSSLKNIVLNSAGTIALTLVSSQVKRWNLSTAFDLSSMTEDASDYISTQITTNMTGFAVKPDGTRFWVSDYNQDLIKQFTMSTAWSPSTANYDGYYMLNNGGAWNNFSGGGSIPSTTNFNPLDFQFNSDGTKMITIMWDNNPYHSVVEFTLSTAWDMSTMSYTSYANLVGNSDPEAIAISADGLNLMMHGSSLGDGGVEVYSLPSAFSVGSAGSNLTRTSGTMDLSALTGNSSNNITNGGLSMSSDGKRMWVIYNNNSGANPIYEITGGTTSVHPYSTYSPALTNSSTGQINSSGWLDIDSMVGDETKNDGDVFYAVSTDNRTSWGVAKASDGVRKIVRNNSGTWQYNNDGGTSSISGYDLDGTNSSVFSSFTSLSANSITAFNGAGFSDDGTKLYVFSHGDDTFYQFTLSTAWDETTASYANKSFTPSSGNNWLIHSIRFNSDGTKMYAGGEGQARNTLYEYTLTTAWDISTANSTATGNLPTRGVSGVTGECENIQISPNGSYVYALDYQSGTLHRWSLNTAWDLSSRTSNSPDQTTTAPYSWSTFCWGFDFSADGSKLYITNGNPVGIGEWDLSTSWSISGLSTSPDTSSTWIGAAYKNLIIGNSGLKLFGVDQSSGIGHKDMGNSVSIYGTSETWVDGTNNNEHATLQQALTSQAFNRMDKAQLDAVADAYHFSQDSADTLDLMIAPYAASGTSPISDGVTIGYQAEALIEQAVNGTDYKVQNPSSTQVKITSLATQNLKIRVV